MKTFWSELVNNTLLLFCKHKDKKDMYEKDYMPWGSGKTYVLTICQKCGKITHGRWMM